MALRVNELAAAVMAAGASAAGTWWALLYARRRQLFDLPGQRRSHQVATARGGGVAIAVVVSVGWWPLLAEGWPSRLFSLAGLLLVAAVGWWDDHRPLSARWRLLAHAIAALVLCGLLLPADAGAWRALVAFLILLSAINVCNFMDGINGLAASQTALLAGALATFAAFAGDHRLALLATLLAAACVGFLPFNFPRARIFLGDVGSGFLGVGAAFLLLLAWFEQLRPLPALLLLPSAFLLDAGLTLLSRIYRGRRWYRPHREHLYQWLVRRGMSHAQVTGLYAGWTLLAAALCGVLGQSGPALAVCGAGYLGGALLWWMAKRRLLQRRPLRVGSWA